MSRAAGSATSWVTAPSLSGPASRIRTVTPRRPSSPISAPAGATGSKGSGPACVVASVSAAPASASRSDGSTTRAPEAIWGGGVRAVRAVTPVKAAVPPARSSLASTGSGTVSTPTQMSTRSPAARAAAATVSRPGPDPSDPGAASIRRTPRAASWPRSPASASPARTSATVMRPPSGQTAVTSASALQNVAGSSAHGEDEHAGPPGYAPLPGKLFLPARAAAKRAGRVRLMRMVAVVLGGGVGQRLGAGMPKQLLTLGGRTLIERCVAAFQAAPGIDEILVVMARGYTGQVEELL